MEKDSEQSNNRVELSEYPGFASQIFEKFLLLFRDLFEKWNLRLTGEFWYFMAILVYILIYQYTPYTTSVVVGVIVLVVLNALIPNLPIIRKRFFKTNEEKLDLLLKENNQDSLNSLRNFLRNNEDVKLVQLKKIFSKRFKNNYEAYNLVFDEVNLSEEEIVFFLKERVIEKEFFDDILMQKFIRSCRYNISHSTQKAMKEQVKSKGFSESTIREFNLKFCRYTRLSSTKKNFLYHTQTKVQSFGAILHLTFIVIFMITLLGVVLVTVVQVLSTPAGVPPSSKVEQNPLNIFLGVIFILTLIAAALFRILRGLMRFTLKRMVPSTLDLLN